MAGFTPQGLRVACIKTLSKSELYDQKEFNGVMALKQIFGVSNQEFQAHFSIRNSGKEAQAAVKWYEARESHSSRSEYRLYFAPNGVMAEAEPGDNVIIGFNNKDILTCILFKQASPEHQGEISSWRTV